jgi:hypothetical protein
MKLLNSKCLSISIVAVMLVISSACNTSTPAPTATPVPTLTSAPTNTSTPVPTNTVVPTATPDQLATESAQATQAAELAKKQVNEDLKAIDMSVETGELGYYQVEPHIIKMDTYGESFYSKFAEDLVAADFILKSDITWKSEGLVGCGIIMRSDSDFKNGKQYLLQYMRFSGLPAWDIEYANNNEIKSIVTQRVRFSDALKMENGASNQFIIVVEGNTFTVYINGVKQGKYYDYGNQTSEGRFGFLSWQEAGPSTCQFENTWIWLME